MKWDHVNCWIHVAVWVIEEQTPRLDEMCKQFAGGNTCKGEKRERSRWKSASECISGLTPGDGWEGWVERASDALLSSETDSAPARSRPLRGGVLHWGERARCLYPYGVIVCEARSQHKHQWIQKCGTWSLSVSVSSPLKEGFVACCICLTLPAQMPGIWEALEMS